ncbi:MAG TPA: helix-turn-helix domain-containing protein [Oligoflexia bacterium]|mgnify:CR=1 FL=1|nr:helix-turn-helix domain-containing protein [Oligoflexia bacterium]
MEALNNDAVTENVGSVLADFGLSDVEVLVYRALLALGSRPASAIAQKSGLKRGQTYNVLQGLTAKGIVQEFLKSSVRHFTCSPPQTLLSILQHREEKIALQKQKLLQVIPHLERLRNPISSQPKVRCYQGIEGIKEVFEDMIRVPNQNIYGLTDIEYSWTFIDGEGRDWINSFIARRSARNIWWLGIMNNSEATQYALKTRKWAKRQVRLIEGLNLRVEIDIYGPKVAITSTTGEMLGIIIESEAIADTLRSIHQSVWNLLPEYAPPNGA